MKKIILVIMCLVSYIAVSAQVKFVFTPEVSTGIEVLPNCLEGNTSFKFGAGFSVGIAKKKNIGTSFIGMYLGRDIYGFEIKSEEKDDYVGGTIVSSTIGLSLYEKLNNGFVFGKFIGYKIWDSEMLVDDEICDSNIEKNYANNFVAKLKIGYGLKHVLFMYEIGYEGGFETGVNIAFPIYSLR